MKKLLSVLAACVLAFPVAACGGDTLAANTPVSSGFASRGNSAGTPESAPAPSSSVPESIAGGEASGQPGNAASLPELSGSETEPQPDKTGSKALVVYFSHTGTTEGVANEIAAQTGAGIFAIIPAQSYTSDYDTLLDIAQRELDEDARPAITGSVEDMAPYDIVYLGWPCWWGDMPMVVCTFLDSCDLSGKTVAPFVTSGGSGFGNALNRLREMEPEATVTEGLSLQGSGSADAVDEWLNGIGLAG